MEKHKQRFSFKWFWGALMTFAYMGIAYLAVFTPVLIRYNDDNDPSNDQHLVLRWIFGLVVFAYGLLRGYRTLKNLKTQNANTLTTNELQ